MMIWKSVPANEIDEKVNIGESLDSLVDPCQAVYIWRRRFVPPRESLGDARAMLAWTRECLSVPIGVIENKRLNHYAKVQRLELSNEGLTPEKRASFQRLVSTAKGREYTRAFVSSLNQFAPVIYLGETSNIHVRLRDHLSGRTALRSCVFDKLAIDWKDVDFAYLNVGPAMHELDAEDASAKRRQLLEAIATLLLFAPFVDRVG